MPGVLERLRTDLEQEPLLGIEPLGLPRGDAEEGGVEGVDVLRGSRRAGC